jgi:hypothetical protein
MRFIAAYVALAFTMCIVVALWFAIVAGYTLDLFIFVFVLNLMVIPLHVIIPFVCVWIVMHSGRHLELWHFMFYGGFCGLFVFVTFPNAEDSIWTFRWKDLGQMKHNDWIGLACLVFSGCVGGWVAGLVGRRTWVERYRV